jgi:3,4-dihydroxy 2-butanone 4-phosphate synthase/GTP cyclohydrolase II
MMVETAVRELQRGGIVIVTDSADRENEGDLIMAAEDATPERIAFLLQHTSGVICASLAAERLEALELPLMVANNGERQGTAFTVTVDSARGISTGISAADRALTLATLGDPAATAGDFVRPGHVFPLQAREGGVLRRAGHTEAALDLARMAGKRAGVLSEVVSEDRARMASARELEQLAARHGLPLISIAELVRHRFARETLVDAVAAATIPTRYGDFTAHAFRSRIDGTEHLAFVRGRLEGAGPVLVRVHSECLTGDVFGSQRCDCGAQLDDALRLVAQEGAGAIVYLRGHEGRGIGVGHKLRAYELQERGRDTVDANLDLGLPVDARDYGIGAQILAQLGIRQMRLLTNNPAKYEGLGGYGLEIVERVPLPPRVTRHNVAYLEAKRLRLGHRLELGDAQAR